ncbi:MAG: transglutaminase-like domain-containing protein [Tannerella sp.]|nr:transglutaminase-like domain-containing protein [Tannerella sp.]
MNKLITALTGFCLAGTACTPASHFITDAAYREDVARTFAEKKALFADPSLFAVFDLEMTAREREAMMFLYAFMPVGDVADCEGAFYLDNVRASFAAQDEMPWGRRIPEEVFRHFVLPVRVGSESLDSSRTVFFDELKGRVKDLPLREAVLEVNHWCHEKVIYTPSDARTGSPLATVRTASGRCGEEATFAVAALRAVAIPARQVYTPRWAHTDDNHAWVEAWVDGQWYFMGACEPEPVLNLAWFNGPARRSMLMHTRVFGHYAGSEETVETAACYTVVNVTENYAPVARMTVEVAEADGRPAAGALVEFKLYNYAEFYTVAQRTTDAAGLCTLTAGRGDMLVWASKDGRFGYGLAPFGKTGRITVALDKRPGDEIEASFDLVPPVEGHIPADATGAQREENARRLSAEDEIRNAYTATFCTAAQASALAGALATDVDKTVEYMLKSRGNHAEIETFLRRTPPDRRPLALALLGVISAKDLRDTPASVLLDHLNNTPPMPNHLCSDAGRQRLFVDCVLNPRVANELLTACKSFFAARFPGELLQAARENPDELAEWVRQHITIHDELNPQLIPVMPAGVFRAGIADARSRDIFFVAAARSAGIPARLEPVTGKVQYYNRQWVDVDFDAKQHDSARTGRVTASYHPVKALDNPRYYSHFTIAGLRPDGRLQTLNFDTGADVDMGAGDTWAGILKNPLPLDEGHYLLVSGTRMASGKVLARIASFTVEADRTTSAALVMREDDDDVQVIGSMDAEAQFRTAGGETASILQTTGRGYFIIGILGANQEPTNHAMRDIAQLGRDFDRWGRPMLLLFENEEGLQRFRKDEFGELPSVITYGVDADGAILRMIASATKLPRADALPVFVIADTFGRIVFVSQGYTIGLGEQMMKVVHKL